MDSVIRRIDFRGPEFNEWVQLRDSVLRKPLGLDFPEEDIAAEAGQDHLCYSRGGKIIAGLILYPLQDDFHTGQFSSPPDAKVYKMRQVAVLPEYQGRGIGQELVRFSEEYVREKGGTHIILHSRETVVPFYQKLRYEIYGKPFEEIGIPHRLMGRKLE